MCHYITLVFPSEAAFAAVEREASRFSLSPHVIEDATVSPQLRPGEVYAASSRGGCQCGTGLGAARDDRRAEATNVTERLRRKGWSDARIRRWLGEKQAAGARRDAATADGGSGSCARW